MLLRAEVQPLRARALAAMIWFRGSDSDASVMAKGILTYLIQPLHWSKSQDQFFKGIATCLSCCPGFQ